MYHWFSLCLFQYCLFEHYHGPSLLRSPSSARTLTRNQLDLCRSLPSFRAYVEAKPDKDRVGLLVDDARCREFVEEGLEALKEAGGSFAAAVRALYAVTKDLPSCPFGKQVNLEIRRHL